MGGGVILFESTENARTTSPLYFLALRYTFRTMLSNRRPTEGWEGVSLETPIVYSIENDTDFKDVKYRHWIDAISHQIGRKSTVGRQKPPPGNQASSRPKEIRDVRTLAQLDILHKGPCIRSDILGIVKRGKEPPTVYRSSPLAARAEAPYLAP